MKNGEKFATVDEREKGFLLFCNRHSDDGSCVKCPLNNKAKKRLGCAYAWLDLEAEEEKPMDCPFCGSVCEIEYTSLECGKKEMFGVHCCVCEYASKNYGTHEEAIAAHNRRCKAVAAYKEGEVK